jgi:hypothetical protein
MILTAASPWLGAAIVQSIVSLVNVWYIGVVTVPSE